MRRETKLQTYEINGVEVPVITPERIAEHEAVAFAISEAKKLHKITSEVKAKITERLDSLLDKIAHNYGEEWKGNAGLFSLDDNMKVIVKVSYRILFTADIAIAVQKYDNWLNSLEGDHELKRLSKRFSKTDSEGYIPKGSILVMYNFDSDNPLKKEADVVYRKAKKHEIRKPYYTFYERIDGEYKRIEVNFSEV